MFTPQLTREAHLAIHYYLSNSRQQHALSYFFSRAAWQFLVFCIAPVSVVRRVGLVNRTLGCSGFTILNYVVSVLALPATQKTRPAPVVPVVLKVKKNRLLTIVPKIVAPKIVVPEIVAPKIRAKAVRRKCRLLPRAWYYMRTRFYALKARVISHFEFYRFRYITVALFVTSVYFATFTATYITWYAAEPVGMRWVFLLGCLTVVKALFAGCSLTVDAIFMSLTCTGVWLLDRAVFILGLAKTAPMLAMVMLCLKCLVIFLAVVMVRVTVPKFKLETLSKLGWLYSLVMLLCVFLVYWLGFFAM